MYTHTQGSMVDFCNQSYRLGPSAYPSMLITEMNNGEIRARFALHVFVFVFVFVCIPCEFACVCAFMWKPEGNLVSFLHHHPP